MVNDPDRFLQMLSTVPAYKEFFSVVQQLAQQAQSGQAQGQGQQAQVKEDDPMPQPNFENPDGSKVYDMNGLKALSDWQIRQANAPISRSVEIFPLSVGGLR